jgi:hypothetical protein
MFRPATPSRTAQKWKAQKAKLLIEFTTLKDEDLFFETGRKQEMIEKIGLKLGKTDDEMKYIFQNLE